MRPFIVLCLCLLGLIACILTFPDDANVAYAGDYVQKVDQVQEVAVPASCAVVTAVAICESNFYQHVGITNKRTSGVCAVPAKYAVRACSRRIGRQYLNIAPVRRVLRR